MKLRSTPLDRAVGMALLASATAALTSTSAFAQEAKSSPTNLDRIEVTGSRIRQVDVETAQPVMAISRVDIERQGFSSVVDILQNITAAGSPALSRSSVLSAGEDAGGSYINLRNLGPQRTLVLINGKRLGISTNGYQDISTIPVSAVERIEVLKDGASAIYGSDAMAGVINIITRHDMTGVVANAYFGQYGQGDGERSRFDVVAGWRNDRMSLTLSAEHSEEKAVWAKDRWFSQYANTDRHPQYGWTQVSQWGQINGLIGGPGCTNSRTGCNYSLNRGTDPTKPGNYHISDPTPFTGDVSNANEQMHLNFPIKRNSLFLDGRFNITDNVRFSTQLGYSKRDSKTQVAGYPLQSPDVGALSIDSYFNPFGRQHGYSKPTAVAWNRRTWEVPRVTTSELKTYRAVAAFDGSFEIGERYFDWEVGYQYNKNELRQTVVGNLHRERVRNAVGPSYYDAKTGKVECGRPGAPIAGCMPWNPLIPYGTKNPYGLTGNQALIDYLMPAENSSGKTTSSNFFANISGSIVRLPAGDLGFAFGLERRKEKGEFIPDALAQTGATTNLAAGPTGGSYTVREAYLELSVPVLANLPGARELTLNAATRFSDYNTFGNTLNSKFGFKWKPFDQLLVRGTWAKGFRAPTISNLYGGSMQSFVRGFQDPCDTVYGASATSPQVRARCARDIANADTYRQLRQGNVPITSSSDQSPVPFVNGANPNLTPETSTSKTLGLVWSPSFVSNFNVSLDWWKIRINNTIVADHPNQMLKDCYEDGVEARCRAFTRDPVLGIVNKLNFGSRNAGFMETEGYDLDLSYHVDTLYGRLSSKWATTYVSKDIYRTTNNSSVVPTPSNGIGGSFRTRSNLTLGWDFGDFGVSWTARYYSGTREQCLSARLHPDECSDPRVRAPWYQGTRDYNKRGSVTFHDVQFRYNLPWEATIAVGANNVFERYGPIMYTAPSSQYSYYGGYDIGRFVYMKYQQRF